MTTGAAAPARGSSGVFPTASISSIGVIPAMASLEKLKPEATAPMSLPSM